jgi:hypothetical protein
MSTINCRRVSFLCRLLGLVAMLSLARVGLAQEPAAPAGHEPAHAAADADDALPHPALSSDGSWAGAMVIIILGMFLAAAAVGVTVRMNMPEELPPPAHSHDEPPGASHHHGHGGTINKPEPEDGLNHGH